MTGKSDDKFGTKETGQRRDAIVKHMIAMPPKTHAEMKAGKSPAAKASIPPRKQKKGK